MNRFLSQQFSALGNALSRLAAAPLNTMLSLLVIGMALTLPCAGWVVLDNLRGIIGGASGVQQISIFMAIDASKKDVAEIESRLRNAKPGKWRLVAKDDALKRLQASEGMSEIVASLPKNPLPDAFVVEPVDTQPESLERLAALFSAWPKVAHVQLDSAWVKRFDAFLRIGRLAITLLAGLLAGALVAVTFNTIRLQILAQAAVIEVAKLIGATDAFIRRPFLYFGALQGALGGLLAALLVALGGQLLGAPVAELVVLYGGTYDLLGLTARSIAGLTGIGALLGWLGAYLSVSIHLRAFA
ncbi:MAG: ABC transporter permease [Propionivibrio sp.]|uniref:permease-like cell division protein FtsX n=1 Tax=Propionivibrio sp. TaxID=2212460 RepID=UPI0025FE2CA5|nr:permease-like cell division protein FtsX [Propionivibrio sp.]MBL0207100.1 ABC transporter permease [Propionivibrio sp.]